MSHAYIKVWIHVVFTTKNTEPMIFPSFEEKLYSHIREHIENDLLCSVIAINGMSDHIHILVQLSQHIAIMDLLKNIKGESSHWINQQDLLRTKFAWQTGYGAFSVSESGVEEVKRYIENQKEHHRVKSFAEEYKKFISMCELKTDESVS
jgi:REP element-mobilizing transposase RayT